jgi:hypothetical protein
MQDLKTRKLTRLTRISVAAKCILGNSCMEGIFVGCENLELKTCLDGFNLLMRVCSGLALNPDYACKLFCAVT